MKKFTKLTCLLFVSLFIVSCSSDDDNTESFTNTVEYDGVSFSVDQAEIFDYGAFEGYYSYGFELVGSTSEDDPIYLHLGLFSEGTESFRAGTFPFYDSDDIEAAPEFVFPYGDVTFDGDNYFEIVGGTVTVTQNGDLYTLSGQLILENDDVVTVSYSGEFEIFSPN
ncbi:hypothetical protein APS56_10235 [Pseudalgibacter alginicilyticus]|uniref:Uncharacterized protein n=1 Tax=Pseudalgibacter alginicilyticus TaxID=1736674 RepID=A0A0P0CRM1_9FLAO|nr:hypothetical protein [Pseudalgibacter alginicilyticus]ALJ05472.1 hypothetical protein APS56_10235 [Pseudalgibacter alginicilyticus]